MDSALDLPSLDFECSGNQADMFVVAVLELDRHFQGPRLYKFLLSSYDQETEWQLQIPELECQGRLP